MTVPALLRLVLLHKINNLVWNPEVLDIISSNIALGESEELVAFRACLHHFFQGEVHPCIAVD